jgi:coenzyme F420-reducing hydrogenase delta subunit
MCSGRIDLEHILRAFYNGQDGVYIGACKLNECNYTTQGNYDALANTLMCKKILAHIGLNPERLRIEFMNASDGIRLAETINDFTNQIKQIGPLSRAEGLEPASVKLKLEAVRKLVPYIRLVERERLRVPTKSKEAYLEFFESDEVDRLFDELVLRKMAISEIMLLLKDKPLTTVEISEALGLTPSEVAARLNATSKQGLIRYDEEQKSYALA